MMSSTDDTTFSVDLCASCGVAAVDDIKLKYVMVAAISCVIAAMIARVIISTTKTKKRKAELRDKDLFTQPDISHWGECLICFLPLSIDVRKSTVMGCCSKMICSGCSYADKKREKEAGLERRCAFCREPTPKSEEYDKNVMERVKKNDPVAMCYMGKRHHGEGDYVKALEYYARAAELGDVEAHACLICITMGKALIRT